MARQIRSLADITPAIINTLTSHSVTV
jgi:hypothetical protein